MVDLLSSALRAPKQQIRVLSGVTSRIKQIAINGDPARLADGLRRLVVSAEQENADP